MRIGMMANLSLGWRSACSVTSSRAERSRNGVGSSIDVLKFAAAPVPYWIPKAW
jgi:hypothetical protein